MVTTLKSRNLTLDKLHKKDATPGPGAYDLSVSAKLVYRNKPTALYKLPNVAAKKDLKENRSTQSFYEDRLAINSTGRYPLSRIPNVNVPHIHKSTVLPKLNGDLIR